MIRFCDVFFSLLGLIVLSPIFVIIALCIVLDSRGGVFYRQVRVGRDGKDFRLFKFRSMASGADKKGLITVGAKDSRVTRVGYFLRKYKLDELPQLLNVVDKIDEFAAQNKVSEQYNSAMWPLVSLKNSVGSAFNGDEDMSFNEAIATMKQAYTDRLNWMNMQITSGNFVTDAE